MKVYIIHQWYGSSQSDWIGWTAQAFKAKDYEVIAPDMPDPDYPKIGPWVDKLASLVQSPDQDTYFIGHSIGCQTIMRYLQQANIKVGGAIFVAGWFDLTNLENKEAEIIAQPWLETPFDTDRVKNSLDYSVAILGDNDPYVPFVNTKLAFEQRLGSQVVVLTGAGHITADDGFGPFPQLLEIFEQHLN